MRIPQLPRSNTNLAVLLFVLAFTSRMVLVFATGQHARPQHREVHYLAASVAEGRGFGNPYAIPTGPTSHFSPGVPLLFAAAYRLFGTGMAGDIATYGLNAAAVSAVYALLPITAVLIGLPRRSGVVAALVGILIPIHFLVELHSALSVFAALCLQVLCLLTAWTWRHNRLTAKWGAIHGLTCGVLLLFSPQLLPVCLAFLVLAWWRYRAAMLRFAAASVAAAVVVLLPWAVRNTIALGSPIWLRGNFGLELQVSNNEVSRPCNSESLNLYHPFVSRSECDRIVSLGEVGYMQGKLEQAERWIRSHPQEFATLTLCRARLFWFPETYRWYQTVLIWSLTALALVSLTTLKNSRRMAFGMIAAIWIVYPLVYYLVQWDNAYRYPIHWTVLLLASHLLTRPFAARDS